MTWGRILFGRAEYCSQSNPAHTHTHTHACTHWLKHCNDLMTLLSTQLSQYVIARQNSHQIKLTKPKAYYCIHQTLVNGPYQNLWVTMPVKRWLTRKIISSLGQSILCYSESSNSDRCSCRGIDWCARGDISDKAWLSMACSPVSYTVAFTIKPNFPLTLW